MEAEETWREARPSFAGDEVFEAAALPARGGVDGPALAFGR
jgi:hypothetical protein